MSQVYVMKMRELLYSLNTCFNERLTKLVKRGFRSFMLKTENKFTLFRQNKFLPIYMK